MATWPFHRFGFLNTQAKSLKLEEQTLAYNSDSECIIMNNLSTSN